MSSGLGVETAAAAMVVVWGCGDERTDDKRRPTKVCPPWQRKRGAPGSGTRASPCGRVLIPFTRSHSRGHRIYVGFDNENKYTRHLLATWDFRAHKMVQNTPLDIPIGPFGGGRSTVLHECAGLGAAGCARVVPALAVGAWSMASSPLRQLRSLADIVRLYLVLTLVAAILCYRLVRWLSHTNKQHVMVCISHDTFPLPIINT